LLKKWDKQIAAAVKEINSINIVKKRKDMTVS